MSKSEHSHCELPALEAVEASKTLQCAINPHVVNKATENQGWTLTHQFENVTLTINELADHINQGHAFCAQHAKQHRKSSNFLRSDVLALDIDQGMRMEDALAHPFVQQYAAILYPTASHMPEWHRFRIVCQTERTIVDADEMRFAYQGFTRKFGGDGSCTDACRLFFGSKGSNPTVLGKILPNAQLDELIALGKERKISDRISADTGKEGSASTRRSAVTLEKDQVVRLSKGGIAALADLAHGTSIHCPVHLDRHPSAFVVTSKEGINGVRCQKCVASYWPPSAFTKKLHQYDFYQIEDIVIEQEYEEDCALSDSDGEALLLPSNEPKAEIKSTGRSSHTFSSQYLPDIPLADGVTFVRSPKGSGKSKWLSDIVIRCRELGKSVLFIGHRQTLIQSMAMRLELLCYFYFLGDGIKTRRPEPYYAICIDSIGRLLDPKEHQYDVVIIDESEQVFSHLTADTLKKKRRTCFAKLFYYLRMAKSVIVADADLGAVTVDAVYQSVGGHAAYRFYLNQYQESRCDFQYYESDTHLVEEMIQAIKSGGRHYVTTNSKNKAEVLQEAICRQFGDHCKIMLVTSDTTKDGDVMYFINNIQEEILKYDVIIASPTLGTGIDITFPEQAQLIDTVFGFFVPRVNTHFDIDQQIARVRHPKAIKVWVTPERFGFETDHEVIRQEIVDNGVLNDVVIDYDDDGSPNLDGTYLSVYAHVTAAARASKNNLRKNLLELRQRNGWKTIIVPMSVDMARNGKNQLQAAQEAVEEKRVDSICAAEKISFDQYKFLQDRSSKGVRLSADEEFSMRRYEIETFYRAPISPELVGLDKKGLFRAQVRLMETYLMPFSILKTKAKEERETGHFISDTGQEIVKKTLLYDLLCSAGLADDENPIKADVVFTKHTLKSFSSACQTNRAKIQELFDVNVRGDAKANPVQQLGRVLDLIGLDMTLGQRHKEGKITTYYYQVEENSWRRMQALIEKRRNEPVGQIPDLCFRMDAPNLRAKARKAVRDQKNKQIAARRATKELEQVIAKLT